MITGINLSQVEDFILKGDTDNPTVWKLGIIPSGVMAELGGSGNEATKVAIKMLQIGIKGWSNFSGVEFRTDKKDFCGESIDVVPMELINKIPLSAVMQIAEKIGELNHLSDIERKN